MSVTSIKAEIKIVRSALREGNAACRRCNRTLGGNGSVAMLAAKSRIRYVRYARGRVTNLHHRMPALPALIMRSA